MIKGIIITSSSGVCLFYKSYGCAFDSEILSNFLVANEIFSSQMIGESMNKIQMKEKTQFVFEKDEQSKLTFVLIADTSDQLFNLQLKLKHVKYAFFLNFSDLCADLQNSQSKYHKIPNRQAVEEIIDPIILARAPQGNILDLINFFGVKNTSIIFSSLLSKQNMIICGKDPKFIEKNILTFPLFLPFREFLITNEIISVEKIGLLIPWIKKFDLLQSPNCWWLIGTENYNLNYSSNKSLTIIDIENKKIINGITPSYYEKYLIKSIKNIKDPQLVKLYLANKIQDLINNTKLLIDSNPISENYLNHLRFHPSILPILTKIAKYDFSVELEIENTYFTTKIKQILGA